MPKITETKKEERKQKILDSAVEVFGNKGYSQSAIDDIVKHSGISKGGIYTYFPTKEAIFLEIANQRFEARKDLVKDIGNIKSAKMRVETYIRRILETVNDKKFILQARFSFEFWTVISRNKEKNNIAKERYNKFAQDFESLILYGMNQKEFRTDLDVKSSIQILFSSMEGIAFMSTVMGIELYENNIDEFVNMYLNYLVGVEK